MLAAFDADVRDPLAVQRPGIFSQGEWFAGGLFEYARAPLLVSDPSGARDPALDHVLALNASGGVAVHDRVRLDLVVPLYFTSTGDGQTQGLAGGDLRGSAMIAILRPGDVAEGVGLALVPFLDVPTGATKRYLGDRTVGGGVMAAGTIETGRFTTTANLGTQFKPEVDVLNIKGEDAFLIGVAGGFTPSDKLGLNLEIKGSLPYRQASVAGTGLPMEGIFSLRHRATSGGHFAAGVATALTPGAGAAAFRLFVGGGFGTGGAPIVHDLDGDGILDRKDACVSEPETVNGFDDEDGCPDRLPALSVLVTYDGAALAGAEVVRREGEAEAERYTSAQSPQTSPVDAETSWVIEARAGRCLTGLTEAVVEREDVFAELAMQATLDGLLVIQVRDEAGAPVGDALLSFVADEPGCAPQGVVRSDVSGDANAYVGPAKQAITVSAEGFLPATLDVMPEGDRTVREVVLKRAAAQAVEVKTQRIRVEEREIVLLEQVFFASGKAVLESRSFPLLDEVVAVLTANPGFGIVEVQGHTDSQGSDALNLELSAKRAKAVVAYLVEHGVKAARLDARGYGETQPIETNRTPEGRAANRRVAFLFRDR